MDNDKLPQSTVDAIRRWFEMPNSHPVGFETSALGNLTLESAEVGKVSFKFKVEERHLNGHGTLHGG